MKEFYFDKDKVNPLCIVAKDVDEYIVKGIKTHSQDSDRNILCLVQWEGYTSEDDSWEPTEALEDVQAFQEYCAKTKDLHHFIKKKKVKYEDITPKGDVNLYKLLLKM